MDFLTNPIRTTIEAPTMPASYKQLTFWQNRKRIRVLLEFRELVVRYYNSVHQRGLSQQETSQSIEFRRKINLRVNQAYEFVLSAGIVTIMSYSPPPMIGGRVQDVDIFANIFNLARFEITPQWVIDAIEKAIGIYEGNERAALLRTLNPLWWLYRLFGELGRVPFRFLTAAGFPDVERTLIGKTLRFLLSFASFVAACATLADIVYGREVITSLISRML